MNKITARKKLIEYFKKNHIDYQLLNEDETLKRVDDLDTIYICTEVEYVIGGYVETSIKLEDEYMYVKTYFCKPIFGTQETEIKAARFANYLNGNVSYNCDDLYCPKYVADCWGDFYRGFLIRYELFENSFYETINHILNYSVQQLSEICIPLIYYLMEKIDYFEATEAVENREIKGMDLSGMFE